MVAVSIWCEPLGVLLICGCFHALHAMNQNQNQNADMNTRRRYLLNTARQDPCRSLGRQCSDTLYRQKKELCYLAYLSFVPLTRNEKLNCPNASRPDCTFFDPFDVRCTFMCDVILVTSHFVIENGKRRKVEMEEPARRPVELWRIIEAVVNPDDPNRSNGGPYVPQRKRFYGGGVSGQ